MHTLFSKPCHVVGRPVFNGLPLDYIDEWFAAKPPEQLLQMYRLFGSGILGDFFQFRRTFEVVSLQSWKSMFGEEVADTEVCELIHAYSRIGIGYGRSGHYYVLDFDTHTFCSSPDLERMLEQAAIQRGLGGLVHFPFFVSDSAVSASWRAHLGHRFFEKVNTADIRGMPIGMHFDTHHTYTLLLDMTGRFVGRLTSAGLMQPDGGALLMISFDFDLAYAPENVFKTLTEIAGEDFRVLSEHP